MTDKKKEPSKQKPPKAEAAKAKELKNYTLNMDDGHYYDKAGKKVTHKGTINLLKGRYSSWKKGQSGNPAGRPQGARGRATLLKDLLDLNVRNEQGGEVPNPLDPKEKKISYEKAIMVALIKKALAGNIVAIQEVQNTLHGKIKDETDVTLQQDEPLEITVKRIVHHANNSD